MSILIKGMEMPHTCYECPFNDLVSDICDHSECPLKEIKERPRDAKGRFVKTKEANKDDGR